MEPGHETQSPATADETPLPIQVEGLSIPPAPAPVPEPPTAAGVLLWVAGAEGAWFPARFATERGVPRDSLDEPLAELRIAGLVLAAEWVRGVGQGYAPTPAGTAVAADPAALERLKQGAPAASVAPLLAAPSAEFPAGEGAVEASAEGAGVRETELELRPPVVVPALLMANAIWFFICVVWGIRWGLTLEASLWRGHPEVLHRFGAVTGLDLLAGEWWRLITCCFVHIGALHLIGNLFALAMMGPLAELLWGRGRLLLIYFISGLAGSALAMAIRPDSLLAGASGAIWGIHMSLFAWLFAFRRQLPQELAADWFRRLSVVFLLNAVVSFLPNVSWEGHLGGGIAGLLTAGLLNAGRFGARPRRLTALFLLALLPALCVAGLGGAMGVKGMTGWQQLHRRVAAERDAREAAERHDRLQDAVKRYAAAEARLPTLAPEAVAPLALEAGELLLRPKRNAPRAEALSARVRALQTIADEIAERTTGDATGVEMLDRRRDRVHRFAAARAKSFELLRAMLDSAAPPAPEAWDAWQATRLDADRLWTEANAK